MPNRRQFLSLASLAAGSTLLERATAQANKPVSQTDKSNTPDLTSLVNVFIGTGGHGHTFPGATVPFGAVQLSPDTGVTEWDRVSGYHHADRTLMGFSHTHLSGTGVGDMLDLLLVPRTGEVILEPGKDEQACLNPAGTYRSTFLHADEAGEPGFYRVLLGSSGGQKIKVELTATERTGLARFTFPRNEPAHILLDWHHAYGTKEAVTAANLQIVDPQHLTGGRHVTCWTADREIYFASELSIAPSRVDVFVNDLPTTERSVHGENLKVALHFPPGSVVLLKTGISMVSTRNALINLQHEQQGFDFEGVRAAAKIAWQRELSRIHIQDNDHARKVIFYSSLYHMMCAPTLADDVNGEYRGMDQQVHQLQAGEHNYSTYSLWDTFRALHPSYTLWQQDRVAPMVNGLIRMAEQSKTGFPVWPLQDGETFCMPGYHGASVIAEACVKNVPGIDWNRAYAAMRKRNMDDNYMGLPLYREKGYIPADQQKESVGQFIEYIYCDWACSHVANATDNTDDARIQRERSRNYRNLFDADTTFIRAKLSDGSWAPNFDPRATGHTANVRDYTEANAWQSTFFVQHDVKGYMQLFGGRAAFANKLDALFAAPAGVSNESVLDMSGFVGQYVHGNEPSHHIAYLYIWAGQGYKTQERIRDLLLTHYHNDVDGLDGNEDCGQMSAWFVMSALGLYAVDPVSGTYVLSAPLFEKASVELAHGRTLTIEARRTSAGDKYIQAITLNGKPHRKLWLAHDDISTGAHLVFVLGSQPNHSFGADETLMPPSLTA